MTQANPELPRRRALHALDRLPAKLRSDVLADGSVAALFDFTTMRPTRLTDEVVLSRDELFATFRDALDTRLTRDFRDENGAVHQAFISTSADGSGFIDIGAARVRFPWITLLTPDIEKRLRQLDTFLSRYLISDDAALSLRDLVGAIDFSDDDFLNATKVLESSPEVFAERLSERLQYQGQDNRISPDDVIPEDAYYWRHLIGEAKSSKTLREYIDRELGDLWRKRIESDASHAIFVMATTFASPALVPHALFSELDTQAISAALDLVASSDDPFTLIGAFEICANRLLESGAFVDIGDRILDRLFSDNDRSMSVFAVFGAIFVIATAYLAEHETLQREPVFWRRLAAAAHAGLITRLIGGRGIDPDEIIEWGMRVSGQTYFLSVLFDFLIEPQWRPEWIRPKILSADIFGRALAAVNLVPAGSLPSSWKDRIEKAYAVIREEHLGPFTRYPSVLEGARRENRPTLAQFKAANFQAAVNAYEDLAKAPSAELLLSISPFIESFGLPDEAIDDVGKVLKSIRDLPITAQRSVAPALSLLAHIAVQTRTVALADDLSELCLEWASTTDTSIPIFEIVCRLVECAMAASDDEKAIEILATRLEILALTLHSSRNLATLSSILESLKPIQPRMATLLGRALALARLGTTG